MVFESGEVGIEDTTSIFRPLVVEVTILDNNDKTIVTK